MTRLLVATRNQGKVRELQRLFDDVPGVQLVSLSDVGEVPEVVEDGDTFEANARKKAEQTARFTGIPTLADDSGLEVDALDGAPGVHSARYAGEQGADDDNNDKLLRELRDVPDEKRSARFRCVLAFADPRGRLGNDVHFEEGSIEGHIRHDLRGEHGFGYDPLFRPQGYDCSMAELDPTEKNRISHRAQASKKMRDFLARYLSPGHDSLTDAIVERLKAKLREPRE